MESKKVLLTVHPAVYARLEERLREGYGSVQEIINELLRKELLKPRRNSGSANGGRPSKKKGYQEFFTR